MLRRTFLVATTAAVGLTLLPAIAGAADTLKIGSIFSLTGSYATIEDPSLKGAKLAVKQVNAAGGVKGQQIELIQYDGSTLPTSPTRPSAWCTRTRSRHRRRLRFRLLSGQRAHCARCRIPYLDVGGTVPNLPSRSANSPH
jgi:branched-chain amino acid transport system substrate-binding protein